MIDYIWQMMDDGHDEGVDQIDQSGETDLPILIINDVC